MKGSAEFIAHEAALDPLPKGSPRPWWEGRPFVAAMILLAFVPLIYPPFPPLVDLPGHMGRYRVALDLAASPSLQQFFAFRWQPIGNLGVDVLAVPLATIIGLENAVKLVVMLIPPLTVAGMLWVAREVHNRLPPTVAFALPLAFSHPFLFGFVNYSLSVALALLGLGLWLRLGRLGQSKLRAMLFVPISFIVFFAHAFGWGMLGLMCFSAEAVRQHDRGLSWWRAGLRAAYHALAMALPIVLMLWWRSDASGGRTAGWWDWSFKGDYLLRILRDRWQAFDLASAGLIAAVPLFAMAHPRMALSRNLAFSAIVLGVCFLLLPRIIFGSAYADMRLAPFALAVLLLAVRFRAETDYRLARTLAFAGLAFLLARTAATTVSLGISASHQQRQLVALDQIPEGARLAGLVWDKCDAWALRRNDHLPSMVIVRRRGFANDQWPLAGSNLLSVNYAPAERFRFDPSEIVRYPGCRREGWPVEWALRSIPRQAFDYLWLVDMPPIPRAWVTGWEPVWVGKGSLLLRRQAPAAPPPATPRTASAAGRSAPPPPRTGGRAAR